jgi:tetratricopeptide (TPR) repeat protein/tRNA A-37 threonylcarbamoyl transferase component Bud32
MPNRAESESAPGGLFESVLARALELRDEGRTDWLREACAACPELELAVREAVAGTKFVAGMFAGSNPADAALGRTIAGRFRLTQRIGAGAMGVVYSAQDLELTRTVAVKILRRGLMDPDESMRRFLREAEAMASVQHRSIITIHDRGRTDDGEPFIVMEWIDGSSLSELVEEARRKSEAKRVEATAWLGQGFDIDTQGESSYLRTVVRWVADLAAGLEVVHAAGILHRDIKPSNVLVRKDGRPVLLDFGVALLDGDSTLTRGPTSVGTPSYMPPESLVRGGRRSPAGDIYSLTATLYHLLTLRPPYLGTPTEVLAAIATRDPVPASRHCPGLPRDLEAILDKGMHRNPRARYAAATLLEADLRAFLNHQPVVARPVWPLTRAARSLFRSKAARGATLAVALMLITGACFGVQRAMESRRKAQAFELVRRLPPNFTVVGTANRVWRYEADREKLAALLDRAVGVGADRLRVHLLRSSFRLDHGDPAGAARDMAAVAEQVGTDFARALARSYAALGPEARGAAALELSGLPERSTPEDRYLEAYHLLRIGQEARGRALLADPLVRRIPHAEELRLAFTPFDDLDTRGEHARALEAYTDVIRLEAQLGGRTAATAHIAGRMLDVMGRYDEALTLLREGVLLADRAHTIRINAGFAALGAGRYDEARSHLEVAIDLRPNYGKPLQDLVWVLVAQEKFDEAAGRIESAPLADTPDQNQWKRLALSSVETYRALALRRAGQRDESRAAVQRAEEHLAAARAMGKVEGGADLAILAGLSADSEVQIFRGLARVLQADPHHAWRLEGLLANMPRDLDADSTAALRGVIEALAERQNGHASPAPPTTVSAR